MNILRNTLTTHKAHATVWGASAVLMICANIQPALRLIATLEHTGSATGSWQQVVLSDSSIIIKVTLTPLLSNSRTTQLIFHPHFQPARATMIARIRAIASTVLHDSFPDHSLSTALWTLILGREDVQYMLFPPQQRDNSLINAGE